MSKSKAVASNATVSAKSTKPAVKSAAPAKGAKAAAKEATPAVVKAPKEAKVKAPKVHVETKADKARALFTSMAGTARKDVVKAFQDQIGLTEAAAATYYQNIKAKASKAAVVTA